MSPWDQTGFRNHSNGTLSPKLEHPIWTELRNLKDYVDIDSEKLEYVSIHDMRHTHASLILNNAPEGEENRYLKIASQRLGHCNIQFTLVTYSEVLPEMEKDVADEALESVEIAVN